MVMWAPWDHKTMALWVMGVTLVMAVTFLNHSAYAPDLVLTGAHGLCGVGRMSHNEHVEWALQKVTDATTPCPINHRALDLGPYGTPRAVAAPVTHFCGTLKLSCRFMSETKPTIHSARHSTEFPIYECIHKLDMK